MQTLTISEIQRNLHILKDFDIIEVIDKRRHITKGYFVSTKHADEIKKIESVNIKQNLAKFAGLWKDKNIDEKTIKQKAWR